MIHNSIIPGDGGVVVPIEVEQEVYVEKIINNTYINTGTVCMCYGNGVFIGVVGNNADEYAYSTDGVRWSLLALPVTVSCQNQSLCYGDGKFVILSGSIGLYSTDGINWTQVTVPFSGGTYKVCYGNGIFFGVANNYKGTNTAIRSTDGVNWNQITLPVSANWSSVCYGAGKFVMLINSSSSAYYSTDGITWKSTSTNYSGWWNHMCYGGKFVSVASNLTSYIYSTDGITWRYNQSPDQVKLNRVWYCLGRFFAMPYNKSSVIYHSTDAITWKKLTMPAEHVWISACGDNNIAVFGIDGYCDKYCLEPTYKELA